MNIIICLAIDVIFWFHLSHHHVSHHVHDFQPDFDISQTNDDFDILKGYSQISNSMKSFTFKVVIT